MRHLLSKPTRSSRLERRASTLLTGLLAMVLLSGCAISTPFKGPGYDAKQGSLRNAAGQVSNDVIVAITLATLEGDRADRRIFWTHVRKVEESLATQPGLLGYSLRTEILGSSAWTLTVWETEDALRAFVEDLVHQDAMRAGKPALAIARFARFSAVPAKIPLAWDDALNILDRDGRSYGRAKAKSD